MVARSILILFGVVLPALASGPPCWDTVSPARKYEQRHIVNGSSSQLSADGLMVSATKKEMPNGTIVVEVTVTNCSAAPVTVYPDRYDLVVLGSDPKTDKLLTKLDPTHFQHPNNPRRPAPQLNPEALDYGRIGSYWLFFAADSYYQQWDHSERLSVVLGKWQFDFSFEKKRTR